MAFVEEGRLAASLSTFEALLAGQGAPVLDHLAPGITPEAAQTAVRPLGITLPVEAEQWYAWHNGIADESEPLAPVSTYLGGHFFWPFSVRRGVETYQEMTSIAADLEEAGAAPPGVSMWESGWFPVAGNLAGGMAAIDVSVPANMPTTVRSVDWEIADWGEPVAPSLTDLVAWWVEALENRLWWFVADAPGGGAWHRDEDGIKQRFEGRAHRLV